MKYFNRGTRIQKLKFILQKIAEIYTPASEVDPTSPINKHTKLRKKEGITHVKVLNGGQKGVLQRTEGYEKVTPGKVNNLMADLKYEGLSELGTQLERKVLKPYVYPLIDSTSRVMTSEEVKKVLRKPLLVIVLTDGQVRPPMGSLLRWMLVDLNGRVANWLFIEWLQVEGKEGPKFLENLILKYRVELDRAFPGGGANGKILPCCMNCSCNSLNGNFNWIFYDE